MKQQKSYNSDKEAKKRERMNKITDKGTLMTYTGKEVGITSTFNQQWKELMTRIVGVLEMIQQSEIFSLSIEMFLDELGNVFYLANYIDVVGRCL